jgi:hypothetical protein
MKYINRLIRGVPYSHLKRRGKIAAPAAWSKAIAAQTRILPNFKLEDRVKECGTSSSLSDAEAKQAGVQKACQDRIQH